MPPPDPIQAANASYGVCLPDGTVEGAELLITPAAPQQSGPAPEAVVEVLDYSQGVSYARPVEITRQPTNVFQANPVQPKQKKAAMALGDALQIWINQQQSEGKPVDPRLQDLALLLHSGQLPDANDPDFQGLVNQSFSDTALDAIVHSVALESDSRPESRSLHARALQYSLDYYLHQGAATPADSAIQQSLVTALANSNNSVSRGVLAETARTANPATQAQIQSALSQAAPLSIHRDGGIALAQALQTNPSASVNALAERSSFAASVTSLSSGTSLSLRLGQFLSSHAEPLALGSAIFTGSYAPVALFRSANLLASLLQPGSALAIASTGPSNDLHSHSVSGSSAAEGRNAGGSNPLSPSPASDFSPRVHPEAASDSVLPLLQVEWSPREILHRSLRGTLGLSETTSQAILDSLPSPFLIGCASIQGGIHQALSGQSATSVPLYANPLQSASSYRVAAISASAGNEFDHEGFGGSQEGSSQGQGGGQGSQSQGEGQHDQEAPTPADVYVKNLA